MGDPKVQCPAVVYSLVAGQSGRCNRSSNSTSSGSATVSEISCRKSPRYLFGSLWIATLSAPSDAEESCSNTELANDCWVARRLPKMRGEGVRRPLCPSHFQAHLGSHKTRRGQGDQGVIISEYASLALSCITALLRDSRLGQARFEYRGGRAACAAGNARGQV